MREWTFSIAVLACGVVFVLGLYLGTFFGIGSESFWWKARAATLVIVFVGLMLYSGASWSGKDE